MADECCGSDAPESRDTDDSEFTAAIEALTKYEKRLLKEVATRTRPENFCRIHGKSCAA